MSLNIGHGIVTVTAVFFIVASYAILFSAILPLTGNVMLDVLANDTHYKYFTLLIIPTGAYFVIANWVGWQYYRNS
ncbi:hypothetical protein DFJ43DRAFT_1159710 [Lentinula guzmanii]|uniref:Uncharacterized protein n=2 Tax=Lentinula TaxID=5352 RepID=A0AA38MVS5_9AGAR|nr:hypothetical protein DFJ43DRAFT_1159710 [Lentinula guzmanii]KAJ3781894.1 hypothetical protein GGU10DRAFT_365253 [Lentinula aff. detonsa]KAJ3795530.1 hypothetical protein GGU11DRAFT_221748 [Lentinula aff. detonsa]